MKKFVKIFAITAMAVSLLATSFAFADGKAPETREKGTVVAAQSQKVIPWSNAKSIFKKELPSKAAIKYVHLTRDDGQRVYKGKAVKGSYVYSIEIQAYTGEILDYERDYEGSRYTASEIGAVGKSYIRAKIENRIPDATIIYIRLTRDDGRYVYEAEAYKNGYEYDFEFTKSGRLIESERDRV